MKKILIYIFMIGMMISLVNAIPLTTFGGDSDPSLTPSDYVMCGGYFPKSSDTLCASFENTSIWKTFAQSTGSVNTTIGLVNISPSGGSTAFSGIMQSGVTPKVGIGYCMDVQWIRYSDHATFLMGFDDVPDDYVAANNVEFQVNHLDGSGDSTFIHYGTNLFKDSGLVVPQGVYQNTTIYLNSSNHGGFYFNNSDVGDSATGGDHTLATNVSILAADFPAVENVKYGITWIAVYNCSEGVPQAIAVDNPPTFPSQSINNTFPETNEVVNVATEVQDDTALSFGRITHNKTGTYINQTIQVLTGTLDNITADITPTIEGQVVGYYFWSNDSSNNAAQTSLFTFPVQDTTDPVITVTSPTEAQSFNKDTSNFTYSGVCNDDFVSEITAVAGNGTDNILNVNNNTPTGTEVGLENRVLDLSAIGVGTYQINYTCIDTSANSGLETLTFTVATTPPVIPTEEEEFPLENLLITVILFGLIFIILNLFVPIGKKIKGGK